MAPAPVSTRPAVGNTEPLAVLTGTPAQFALVDLPVCVYGCCDLLWRAGPRLARVDVFALSRGLVVWFRQACVGVEIEYGDIDAFVLRSPVEMCLNVPTWDDGRECSLLVDASTNLEAAQDPLLAGQDLSSPMEHLFYAVSQGASAPQDSHDDNALFESIHEALTLTDGVADDLGNEPEPRGGSATVVSVSNKTGRSAADTGGAVKRKRG